MSEGSSMIGRTVLDMSTTTESEIQSAMMDKKKESEW
jgi:hypothetical protein